MLFLYLLLFLAVFFDVRTFRIPNGLIVAGFAAGLSCRFFFPDAGDGVLSFLLASPGMFLLLIPLFKIRAIGGGDVKLLSVVAGYIGFERGLTATIYALFAGAVISVFSLVYHRFFSKNIYTKNTRHVIHFSIPIALGVLAERIWGGVLWQG